MDSLKLMRECDDARDIDAENFYRLVLIVRSISISRPQNLAKFTEQYTNKPIDEINGNIIINIITNIIIINYRIIKFYLSI